MKTFTETQMLDPWGWCMRILEKHDLLENSREVAEAIAKPRSTVRALFNGTNRNPRYDLLQAMLVYCIELERLGEVPARAKKVAPKQPKPKEPAMTIEDLL